MSQFSRSFYPWFSVPIISAHSPSFCIVSQVAALFIFRLLYCPRLAWLVSDSETQTAEETKTVGAGVITERLLPAGAGAGEHNFRIKAGRTREGLRGDKENQASDDFITAPASD